MGARVVLALLLGLALAGPAAALPVVADSPSLVLRASHIVVVEIVAARDDGVDGERRPMTALRVRATEVLKGTLAGGTPATADVRVVHYPPGTPTTARQYGAWSYTELTAGARFVVMAAGAPGDAALAELLIDPIAIAVEPPEAADQIRLIVAIDRLPLTRALAQARPRAATLGGLFADYVLARRQQRQRADADDLAALIELPALASEARTTLVMNAARWSAGDAAAVDRLAVALFRVLRLDEAAPLRDNLIGTWIPDLIGLDGGDRPRTAAQVFRGRARDRQQARAALAAYRGPAATAALLTWLR